MVADTVRSFDDFVCCSCLPLFPYLNYVKVFSLGAEVLFYISKCLLISTRCQFLGARYLACDSFVIAQIWQLQSDGFKIVMNTIKFFVDLVKLSCGFIPNKQECIWWMETSKFSLAPVGGLQVTSGRRSTQW